MKLNSRSALDPRWTRHHVDVVGDFMLATIDVIRKNPGVEPTYNPTTRTWTGSFSTIVSGASARLQPFGVNSDTVVGQDPTGRKLMRVQVKDVNLGIKPDDIVVVKSCPDNPDMLNYQSEVRSAVGSSNDWTTTLVCETNTKGTGAGN